MKVALLTISDGCHAGRREDVSGSALAELLAQRGWKVAATGVVPDEEAAIRDQIVEWCRDPSLPLVVTTGGTGLGPRDRTPEAVLPLLERQIPGMGELMRARGLQSTPRAALSRSLAGVRQQTLILCLPGSPRGALQSLEALLEILPHALDLIQGQTHHPKN